MLFNNCIKRKLYQNRSLSSIQRLNCKSEFDKINHGKSNWQKGLWVRMARETHEAAKYFGYGIQ